LEVGSPGKWRPLSVAPSVSVRRGAGASGTDRVTLVLPDGVVLNTWLRVTVKAGSRTGLMSSDVFYFGNLVGDVGGAGAPAVNATDLALTRANFGRTSAAALSRYDFNRDGLINAADVQLVRVNQRRSLPLFAAPDASAAGAPGSTVGDKSAPPARTRPVGRGLLGEAQPELLA
jgi:hypothetical protein